MMTKNCRGCYDCYDEVGATYDRVAARKEAVFIGMTKINEMVLEGVLNVVEMGRC